MPRAWLLVLSACGRFGFSDAPIARSDASGPPDELGLSQDATLVADGVAAAACGTTAVLQDAFDVAGAAPTFGLYTDSGLSIAEANGQLEVTFNANVADGRYAGYKSVASFAPEGLCGSVRVVQVPGSSSLTFFKFITSGSDPQMVEFSLFQGFLSARTHLDRQVATLLAIPFDIGAHRWWRLRQQGGVTYWDVSGDGVSYSLLASTTFLTDPTIRFELGAGSFGSSMNAGVAAFDDALLTMP